MLFNTPESRFADDEEVTMSESENHGGNRTQRPDARGPRNSIELPDESLWDNASVANAWSHTNGHHWTDGS